MRWHKEAIGQTFGVVLICCVAFMLGVHGRERKVIVASDGKSTYSIVIPQNAIPQERLASSELQKYIERISGAKLPIETSGEISNGGK